MSIIDELIFDRTQADVDRQLYLESRWDPFSKKFSGTLEEADEWLAGTKGTYGAADLNRVGEALIYIAERFNAAGYTVEVSPRTDWSSADWVTPSVANQLLRDLKLLRSQFSQEVSTPSVPDDMEELTYTEANAIEQILAAVDHLLSNIMAAWYSSGDLYCGEV